MTAPVLVKVTRYACPFCTRSRAKKTATAAHIGRCWSNPANRTCKTCRHFEEAFTAAPEDWCFEGRRCSCNDSPASCEAGVDLPDHDALPVVGCPLWEAS
jgi:hypothetical protein